MFLLKRKKKHKKMGKSCINEPKVATIKRPDERIVKET